MTKMSPSQRWLTFPQGLALIFLLGLGLPILGSALSTLEWADWRWPHPPFHFLIEMLGGILAILLGSLIVRQGLPHTVPQYFGVACGLITMGVLDIFHAVVPVGKIFVWFHSIATFMGGGFFMMGYTFGQAVHRHRQHAILTVSVLGVVTISAVSFAFPSLIPAMVENGQFTALARALNILGGVGFWMMGLRFIGRYRQMGEVHDWLFAIHCVLFGAAGVLFELSSLWDAAWWWWHLLRLVAYGTGVQCIMTFATPIAFARSPTTTMPVAHIVEEWTARKGQTTWLPMLVVALIVSALFVGAATLYLLHGQLVANEGRSLSLVATHLADRIDQRLAERSATLRHLAALPVLQTQDRQAITTHLRQIAKNYPDLAMVSLTNAQGEIMASTRSDLIGQTAMNEPVFAAVRATHTSQVQDGRPFVYLENRYALLMGAPVMTSQQQIRGVVLAHLSIPFLKTWLTEALHKSRSNVGLQTEVEWQVLRKDGTLLIDSVLHEEGQVNLLDLGLPSARAVLETSSVGFEEETHLRRQISVLTGYASTHEDEDHHGVVWGILVRKTPAEVVTPIMAIQWKVVILGFLLVTPLVGLIFVMIRRLQIAGSETELVLQLVIEKEARQRLLFDTSPNGLLIVNEQGQIVQTNQQVLSLFGYTEEELQGNPVETLLPERFRKPHQQQGGQFVTEGQPRTMGKSGPLVGRRQDGTEFQVEVGLTPVCLPEGLHVLVTIMDVTAREAAAKKIQELLAHNQLILDSAADGIYGLDPDGTVTFVNPAAAHLLGYSQSELLGQPMHALVHHSKADGTPYPREACPMYASFRDGQVHTVNDDVLWRKDGTRVSVEYTSTPIRDAAHHVVGAVVIFRDITDQKERALELENRERLLQLMLETGPGCIKRVAADGTLLHMNAKGLTMIECPTEAEALGQSVFDLVLPEYREAFHLMHRRVIEGHTERLQFKIQGMGGTQRWMETYATPFKNPLTNQVEHLALTHDISERKRAETEREQLIRELEAKNAELERFTYTVSHDLKSPLVTIEGFLGFVQQDAMTHDVDQLEKDLQRIRDAVAHMQRLLGELLELSRIGRLANPTEQCAMDEVVRRAIGQLEGVIAQRGVQVDIATALPQVTGDVVRLIEVIQNLVENAIKFMGGQPDPRIEIGVREDGEDTVLFVRDNGAGIDPAYQEKVFDLFERLEDHTEGTGIGLALVKRIVEVHGGHIWVESEGQGHGSTFCFTLSEK